jgi:pimeloyl-ACP methyl ester carboxylesterase
MTTSGLTEISPFPAGFVTRDVSVGDATIHVRSGGRGPAVLMLHGFGDTGDMWQPLAVKIKDSHTSIVPDLRGMGLSSHPPSGYTKKSQAEDMMKVLDALDVQGPLIVVTHDIGNMVGYAFVALNRQRVTRWVVMDAPLPGIGHWDDQLKNPKTWHFNFRGPDVERLVAGRERIFLDRFWNELSANPAAITEPVRVHYAALYARPQAMHDAFEQFGAFAQDATDNQAFLAQGKLAMPVLAIGGDHSYGPVLGTEIGFAATDVKSVSIADSGHWLMEEQPAATIAAITASIGV